MEPLDRAAAVMTAFAHDMNNNLTIILSATQTALENMADDDPDRPSLIEAKAAAQRCVWKSSGMLNFAARISKPRTKESFEKLIEI